MNFSYFGAESKMLKKCSRRARVDTTYILNPVISTSTMWGQIRDGKLTIVTTPVPIICNACIIVGKELWSLVLHLLQ